MAKQYQRLPYNEQLGGHPEESTWFADLNERFLAKPWHYRLRIYLVRFWRKAWWLNPKRLYRAWLNRHQRAQRGWGYQDAWSFDYYVTNIIIGGVKRLIEINHGWPESPRWPTPESYIADLEKMVWGLEHYQKAMDLEECCSCCDGKYCLCMECPIIKDAFNMMILVWPSLWD